MTLIMKHLFVTFFLLTVGISLCAQELKVKSFGLLERDLLARTQERLDLNDEPCAVVRISVPQADSFEFEGNIIGDPEYHSGEAIVWMTSGSRNITMKSNVFGTLRFEFPRRLEKSTVYELVVLAENNITDQGLLMNYTPAQAKIYIDDELQTEAKDGFLSTVLPIGEHKYRVEHPRYQTEQGVFNIIQERPSTIDVTLQPTNDYAFLHVNSNKKETKVYIDDEFVGYAPYRSDSIASGTHQVRVERDRHRTQTQEVTIPYMGTKQLDFKMKKQKFNILLMAQYDRELISQDISGLTTNAFGFMLGFYRKHGFYLGATMDFSGYSDADTQFDKTYFSMRGGFIGHINNYLQYYVGTGISGSYDDAYGSEFNGYEAVRDAFGLLLDCGLIARYRFLAFSLGYTQSIPCFYNDGSVGGAHCGLTIGIGFILNRSQKH